MAFFPIDPLGRGSFKAAVEDKHSGDLPGSEQWDRLSSCVLHKMSWLINFSMMLSFFLDVLHCLLISNEQWHRGEGGTVQSLNFAHSLTGITALLVCFVIHHSAHK